MPLLVATSLADALEALAAAPTAQVLAGGTDLVVELNERHRHLADDATVVAVNRVPELRTWTLDRASGIVRLGSGVTYGEIAAEPLRSLVPALAQAARTVGSPQIRNAATIGGNVATSSPAGDGLPPLFAVDAVVELVSADRTRRLPIADFMLGVKRTALEPGELIAAVEVPLLDGWQGYAKVGVRNAMVIAISGACLAVDEPSRTVRLALGSVAPTIVRATAAEQLAAEAVDWDTATVSAEAVAEFRSLAGAAARPIDDHRASAAYRRHSIGVLAGRLLARAFPAPAVAAA